MKFQTHLFEWHSVSFSALAVFSRNALHKSTFYLLTLLTMPNSNSALFVQPYSLWNEAITGHNGACAKIVFTARRHVLARSLLSARVRPSVRHVRLLYCSQTAEDIIKHLSRPGSPMILTVFHKIGTPLYFCNNFFKCWSIWMKITSLYSLGNLLSCDVVCNCIFYKYFLYSVIYNCSYKM